MKKLIKFLKDTGGNVAVTGAIMVVPIMLSVGAAVDYTAYSNMRSSVQSSLDASGLAAAQHLNQLEGNHAEKTEQLKEYAENFFKANLAPNISESDYVFNLELVPGNQAVEPPTPDRINITADITYDTMFGGTKLVDRIEDQIGSIISLGNRTVEVALVLDNSGSMGGSRLSTLKRESKNLVDIVYGSATLTTLEKPVQFSLVPFAGSVNVGTNNVNASWMDRKGWSPVHHENLDWEQSYRTNNNKRVRRFRGVPFGFQERVNGRWTWKTRMDVFDMIGEPWSGCVEMRPWPHNVMDTSVNTNRGYRRVLDTMDADGNGTNDGTSALFVPYFAPDEPDRVKSYTSGRNYYDSHYFYNDYLYDFEDYNPSNPGQRIQLYTRQNSSNYMYGKEGSTNQVLRTNAVFKYQRNNQYRGTLYDYRGPNYGCTTRAIMELSDNPNDVKSELDEMRARGSTNIQQGITWGWRTLSPGEPFATGRENDDRHNLKMLVVLTDGNNFYSSDYRNTPNNTSYGAWGYARPDAYNNAQMRNALTGQYTHNRWAQGLTGSDLQGTIYSPSYFDLTPESGYEFSRIMDAHTNQACNNIKNDGITIFTVAFDVPRSGGVRDLMEACAGSGIKNGQPVMGSGEFYFDVDQGGLSAAFTSIARQIANLRIAG